jgi:hypothetical protein
LVAQVVVSGVKIGAHRKTLVNVPSQRKKMRNVAYFVAIVIAWTVLGCATKGSGSAVFEHQREIAELEARNQELERRLAHYNIAVGSSIQELKSIAERSRGVEGEIDELIDLFGQYQRAVARLIEDHQRATSETGE